MFSTRARYSKDEWRHLQESLDRIYDDFTSKVAAGRGLDRERVHEIARGRVWTGADARDRGLVDEFGGLRRALELTRERAGLPYDTPVRPFPHVPLIRRLRRPTSSEDPAAAAATTALPGSLGELAAAMGLAPGASLLMPPLALV
jgi:protease-4